MKPPSSLSTISTSCFVAGALVAIIAAVGALVANQRKPQLDEAQTEAVKIEVAKESRRLNLARDQRVLDLEVWGDAMRPWASAVNRRDEQMLMLIEDAYVRLGMPMPVMAIMPPMPKFPEPRP